MNLNLKEHNTVITGGASGIGWACAQQFAQEGSRVSLWDLSEVVRGKAATLPTPSHGIVVDVSDPASVRNALGETDSVLGPVKHLVHAAAVGSGKFGFPFTNLQPEDWGRVLQINVMGMVHVAHTLAPGMIAQKTGSMIFIASVAGQIGSQTDPPYSASKAANINFAQCLAKDLAPHNIRVNIVNPGMVQTPLNRRVWQAWHDQQSPEKRRSYEDWATEKVRAVAPLGRWQTPEDIANTVVFLSSVCAEQITGQTINVDGGQVMHW